MRQLFMSAVLAVGLGGLLSQTASAGCPPWRPCGSGHNNWLIPQGAYGADFRPACARHDVCYQSCGNRRLCDIEFRNNLHQACECSRNPGLCRLRANTYYMSSRLFGGFHRQ